MPMSLWARLVVATFAVVAGCSSVEKTPGDGGGGGQNGQGGDQGSSCSAPYPECIPSCAVDRVTELVQPRCDADGVWRCPSGSVDYASCPRGSCANPATVCCDVITGGLSPVPCGANGLIGACPLGSRADPSLCIPDGLDTTDCVSLSGKACTQPDQQCSRAGDQCTCKPGDAGLAWECAFLIN